MLPEDLLLLFIDQQTGHTVSDRVVVENALAGALLIELVRSGRLAYAGQLVVADATPLPRPFEQALTRLKAPLSPRLGVQRVRNYVRDNVMTELEARGVLTTRRQLLGGFVIQDHEAVNEVRTAVGSVLFGHRPPDARSGALISLLHAVKRVHKVFSGERHELTARAKQIAEGHSPAVVAVHDAVALEMVLAETKVGFLR